MAASAQNVTGLEGLGADELVLLQRARAGDEDAFGRLAGVYRAELRARCYRIVGSAADAEDALQEGLLGAWKGLHGFEGRSSVRSWLYAVVTNSALDLARDRSRRELPVVGPGARLSEEPRPDDWVAEEACLSPEARYELREGVELAVMVVLQHLPPLQRAVLLLREVVGFSSAEIAARLGTTAQAVNSALQRARAAVRDRLAANCQQPVVGDLGDQHARAMVRRYADAIERGDSDSLVSMLTHDVLLCRLPALDANFAGRDAELAALDRLLDEVGGGVEPLVISISGTAGVGKTALAVHWAHRVASRFGDGQLYLNLHGFGPYAEPVPVARAIRSLLEGLQVPPGRIPADAEAQAGLYRSLLAGRRTLILLDNARDANHVRELLPDNGDCLAVVTSRGRLPDLAAAGGAHLIWLDVLTRADARSLLEQRLGAGRLHIGAVVDELIELCARLPLALAVTAAHAAEHPERALTTVVAQLRDERRRLDALETGDPATGVRSVLSCSYRQLSDPAGRMFRLLGVHPGPDLTVPAAASLARVPEASARRAVSELTRSGLLAEHVPGRFSCHDLLRGYAAQLTRAHDREADRRTALRRVLDYYLQTSAALSRSLNPSRAPIPLLSPADQEVVTPQNLAPAAGVAWFEAEHQVLMAAIARAAQDGFEAHAWQLARAIETALNLSGRWQDMQATHRLGLQAARRIGDLTGQAHALNGLGWACTLLGAVAEGISYLSRALEMFDQLDDDVALASAHLDMSHTLSRANRYGDAMRHAERARDLFRTAEHKAGQAAALNSIGWNHIQLGNNRRALPPIHQALAAFRQLGDRLGQAWTLDSLGVAHHHLGDYARGLELCSQALDLFREFGNRLGQAETLDHMADAHQEFGDEVAARDALTEALVTLGDLNPTYIKHLRSKLQDLR